MAHIHRLQQKRKPVNPGDPIEYVYVDCQEVNPMKRVAPSEFADTYDTEKYAEMLLDVAESVLGVFGFSRTQLGFQEQVMNLNLDSSIGGDVDLLITL